MIVPGCRALTWPSWARKVKLSIPLNPLAGVYVMIGGVPDKVPKLGPVVRKNVNASPSGSDPLSVTTLCVPCGVNSDCELANGRLLPPPPPTTVTAMVTKASSVASPSNTRNRNESVPVTDPNGVYVSCALVALTALMPLSEPKVGPEPGTIEKVSPLGPSKSEPVSVISFD